jgi:uncharacterized membrane protein YhiD involved in acid resistance
MILVKTLIFLLLMLIISHVYKKLSERDEKREGFKEENTSTNAKKKIPNKKETDEVTQKAQDTLTSFQIPKEHQDAILNKIKDFKLDGDMSDLQGKLDLLLTLSDKSKKINEGLTQQKQIVKTK